MVENTQEMESSGQPGKNELKELDTAKPADFSFKKLKVLAAFDIEQARATRIGRIPEKGPNHKFLTRAVWLNNNKLASMEKLDVFLVSILEYPERLGWLDLSYNHIVKIDPIIQKYVNLKIIYFHGNKLHDLDEVKKLATFEQLRSVTFHGNPFADKSGYRSYVLAYLPQVSNIDFTPVTKCERLQALPIMHNDE